MKETTIKTVISTALTGALAYFNVLVIPLIMLFVVIIADYITGIARALIFNSLSSKFGIIGIVKKLCFFLAVGVACVVDWLLNSALLSTGINVYSHYGVAILVCIWLIINECISILENLKNIGVPLPSFLTKILNEIKEKADQNNESTFNE